MPIYKNTYSRGNDDPGQNVYETARIEVTLEANTDACEDDGSGNCVGEVALTLTYKAIASTSDPLFVNIGPRYALREAGPGGASAQLVHGAGGAAGPAGDTLTAQISLGTIPCSGGAKKGEVGVEVRVAAAPGAAPEWTGFVQQRIFYDLKVNRCGDVILRQLEAKQLNPGGVAGTLMTPLRQLSSSYASGAGGAGYLPFPGQSR